TICWRAIRARRCDTPPRRGKQKKTRHGELGTHRGGSTSGTPGRGAKGGSGVPAFLPSRADHERRRRTRRPRAAGARPPAGAPRGGAVQPPPAELAGWTFTVSAAVDFWTAG